MQGCLKRKHYILKKPWNRCSADIECKSVRIDRPWHSKNQSLNDLVCTGHHRLCSRLDLCLKFWQKYVSFCSVVDCTTAVIPMGMGHQCMQNAYIRYALILHYAWIWTEHDYDYDNKLCYMSEITPSAKLSVWELLLYEHAFRHPVLSGNVTFEWPRWNFV